MRESESGTLKRLSRIVSPSQYDSITGSSHRAQLTMNARPSILAMLVTENPPAIAYPAAQRAPFTKLSAESAVDRLVVSGRTIDDHDALIRHHASALPHDDTMDALIDSVYAYFAHRSPNMLASVTIGIPLNVVPIAS